MYRNLTEVCSKFASAPAEAVRGSPSPPPPPNLCVSVWMSPPATETARFLRLASRNFFNKATFALDNQLQPVQHVRVWPGRGGRAMRSPRLLLRLPLPPSTACSAILVSFLNTSRAEADDAKRLKLCYRNRGLLLLHIEAPSGHGLNLPFLLGV